MSQQQEQTALPVSDGQTSARFVESEAYEIYAGQEWRASLLRHRPVVNARTVEEIGSVTDIVFDPDTCRLTALALGPGGLENNVATLARRAFGGGRNLSYIPIENIIALNSDVVTVDFDPARPAHPQHVDRLPHLSHVHDLAVITLHGLRLGRLVDLLLDSNGSHVIGYLINPTRRGANVTQPLAAQVTLSSDDAAAESDAAERTTAPESLPSNLRVIPASPRVRIGRALILVVEEVEPLQAGDVVVTGSGSQPLDPFADDTPEREDDWRAADAHLDGNLSDEALDAPTQELRH